MREWWLWVATEQTERIVRESKTRDQLSGPFFGDWFKTVSDYHFDNWNDGGKVFTSYLAHPTQGAVAEAIFWQNNDHVRFSEQDFHSARYRNALLQAFAFATVDAVLWKMGPLSESSIGNVGLPVHWWDADCKAAPHSLRRPDRRERYGDERGGRDGDHHRLPVARQARSERDRRAFREPSPGSTPRASSRIRPRRLPTSCASGGPGTAITAGDD